MVTQKIITLCQGTVIGPENAVVNKADKILL